MNVISVRYNFLKDFFESNNMFCQPNDYKNLRSVVWPTPLALFTFIKLSSTAVCHIHKIWMKNSSQISTALAKLNLKDPGNIVCYVHGISCEGWFDVDDNSIHIRFSNSNGDKELLNTMIHEIIHLSTYDNKLSSAERENIVEKYMGSEEIQEILKSIK